MYAGKGNGKQTQSFEGKYYCGGLQESHRATHTWKFIKCKIKN